MVWPWLSPLSFVDTLPLVPLLLLLSSKIYCHEDVIDFTNPFLDFDEGYQAPRKVTAIPVSPRTVLPKKLLTRWGYPRGESQGDSSGWCPSLLPFDGSTDRLPGNILFSSKPLPRKGNHHHPSDKGCVA